MALLCSAAGCGGCLRLTCTWVREGNAMATAMLRGDSRKEQAQAVKDLGKRWATGAGCGSDCVCWCSVCWQRQHVRGSCTQLQDGGLALARAGGGFCTSSG